MRKLHRGVSAIADGEALLFSHFADGGEMWTGQGERTVSRELRFDGAFLEPPAVRLWVALWDVCNEANLRLDLRADNIGCESFLAVASTWGDSRIARLRIAWLAIGVVADDERWDVG